MGREIRRVPANWQHPTEMNPYRGEVFKPLLGDSFAKRASEWDEGAASWARGERPEYFDAAQHGDISYEDWTGERPDPSYYVPYDVEGDLPWWQVYETVSEGTPVTPAFATADALIEHLVSVGEVYDNGERGGAWPRDRAEAFVRNERWFPTMVIADGRIYDAKSGMPEGRTPIGENAPPTSANAQGTGGIAR